MWEFTDLALLTIGALTLLYSFHLNNLEESKWLGEDQDNEENKCPELVLDDRKESIDLSMECTSREDPLSLLCISILIISLSGVSEMFRLVFQ